MFSQHVLASGAFAHRFIELLPEYLPGVDTGAFEATDRRRCWNKTLKSVLTVMGKEDLGLDVESHDQGTSQSSVLWQRGGAPLFAMTTGWGDRKELETCLEGLESYKCPQKLFVYSCGKWQDAVREQIEAILFRYPYHIQGEQYLFLNLIASENRVEILVADLKQTGQLPPAHGALLQPMRVAGLR